MTSNLKNFIVTSAPAAEPVSRSDMKNYLRLDASITTDDDLIDEMIAAARIAAEQYTRRSFITQTLKLTLDDFPYQETNGRYNDVSGVIQIATSEVRGHGDFIFLPGAPIQSITSIVTYDDGNNSSTFSSSLYRIDVTNSRVLLNDSQQWPTDLRDKSAVEVTYVAGYGASATAVPAPIRLAIKMHVQKMYDSRTTCDMPEDCKKLLAPYRIIDRLSS